MSMMPQPFPDLSDEENAEIWSICCSVGCDRLRGRKIWEMQQKLLKAMNKQYTAREWRAKGNVLDEQSEVELLNEEVSLDAEAPDGWLWVERDGKLKLVPTEATKRKWRKDELMSEISEQLEESRVAQEEEDALIRLIREQDWFRWLARYLFTDLKVLLDNEKMREVKIVLSKKDGKLYTNSEFRDMDNARARLDSKGDIVWIMRAKRKRAK